MVRFVKVFAMMVVSIGAWSSQRATVCASPVFAHTPPHHVASKHALQPHTLPPRITQAPHLEIMARHSAPIQDRAAQEGAPPVASPPGKGNVVNLNTATAAELEALPGIGASTAARIVEYRQKNGNFKKIEDLMNVRGIGEKSFLKLKPLITVTPMKADRGTGASQA
jgi:comEA protein